uniref:WH2 domain-containing protein n=2 Tax=Panagrolaimus sp. ES5 TaxID=591445 RepID=A0AC34F7Y7_9BILA
MKLKSRVIIEREKERRALEEAKKQLTRESPPSTVSKPCLPPPPPPQNCIYEKARTSDKRQAFGEQKKPIDTTSTVLTQPPPPPPKMELIQPKQPKKGGPITPEDIQSVKLKPTGSKFSTRGNLLLPRADPVVSAATRRSIVLQADPAAPKSMKELLHDKFKNVHFRDESNAEDMDDWED